MIPLKSKTLKNYYGDPFDDYELKYIHYNLIIENDSKEEYQLLMDDIKTIKQYIKDSFLIYFSDVDNLRKVLKNTKIVHLYQNDIYLRIRNQEEYNQYRKLNVKLNLIIENCDLQNINIIDDAVTIQIDTVSELSISKLKQLQKKVTIKNVLVGQIAYITKDYAYLLDIMKKMYPIKEKNQLELEKNNKVTNDIYDIDTYCKIMEKLTEMIKICYDQNKVKHFTNIFYYIAKNISYDTSLNSNNTNIRNQNLIGVLFDQKGVCEGYSKLLQQLSSLIGIKSIVISGGGKKSENGHVWNQVLINNKWYHADVTSQSWSYHNKEDKNFCLVDDASIYYETTSLFAHKCKDNFL